jgi:hypothetical protein
MRVFLLDLWLDLKEKRLAPVAIILLAALIAVPIVLAKGTSDTTTTPTAATPTTTVATAAVVTTSTGPTDSKLQTFSSRDPFEPTVRVSTATSTTTTSTGTGTGTSTGTSTSGSSGSSGSTSGGGTTGSQPSTGTGTTTPSGTGNTTGETKTTLFTYTVDLRFGQGGSVKAYKNVKRLELIPTADNPKVVFLGVTTSAKTAVFLVDKNIGVDTAGGKCQPSADECTFLYLRPDADHDQAQLTDADGTVYHLRVLDINRVTVSSSNGSTTNGSGSKGNSNSNTRSPAFTGRKSSDPATVPGDTPPGEPDNRSSFQQFFADSSN